MDICLQKDINQWFKPIENWWWNYGTWKERNPQQKNQGGVDQEVEEYVDRSAFNGKL